MKIKHFKKLIFVLICSFLSGISTAQSSYQFHSHNDYAQEFPFWKAYIHGASSIEADVFLKDEELFVTHTEEEIEPNLTLENLYLKPLSELAKSGKLRKTQLLIDLKSSAQPTLKVLMKLLKNYPELTKIDNLSFVISGNRPGNSEYKNYPDFIQFDHQDVSNLDEADLSKIALISKSFKEYSVWNGLGRITAPELQKVEEVIKKAHDAGKPFRFWGAPDTKTAWSRFAAMGVDFINTDKPAEASAYLESLDNRNVELKDPISVYHPKFNFDKNSTPKNIILMIGDGNGLSQISSAMIANRGELTLTQLQNLGFVKTSSFDDLVTDSAAGGTAMATGEKTNNRAIGTDAEGKDLVAITEILNEKGYLNGILTTDYITGATPSSFYAHVVERDDSNAILEDLKTSNIDFFVAAGSSDFNKIQDEFVQKELSEFNDFEDRTSVFLSEESLGGVEDRGNQFPTYVQKVLQNLENQEKPYFLMIEGAKIDKNGHTNNASGIVQEILDFDKTIAEVLKVADKNENTLVVITADHETSGFGIMQGNLEDGKLEGGFLTNDHTAVMVPLFSYGPKAELFNGVYENTEIFHRILEALNMEK
ncbi:alkaline phosphatase [Zunongwangia endophytica]|uniref:Alkaline phosphatase n=1 Tax=Zunongwangia endophytica TaxID=1808945 RepID=A0ABV8H7F4_9FLAO|nr:alkaline phosphatase [Zunongwangia endophytica]MDN3593739.1 alkaline phosphatase [Zunongwangia endophytica]